MSMRSFPNVTYAWVWIYLVLALAAPISAVAQSRSDTGRHTPEPPAEKKEDDATGSQTPSSVRPWHFGFCGGAQGGSDLFRVEVINGPAVPWDPDTGGGFQSSRFTASLDRNFSLGFFLSRDLGSVWSVRMDFGYSRMDVAAEALLGQTGAVFLFDRMNVLNLGLGMEARLARAASYPYFLASFLVSNLGPVRADALAQTNLGGRLGLGFFHPFQNVWGLRLEARVSGTGFSVGDYVPQSTMPDQPVLNFTSEDHLVFFEFLVGMQASF